MSDEITRKHFLQAGAAVLLTASLPACDSDEGDDDEDGGGSGEGGECTGTATGNIASNHGHSLSVPSGDINDGAAMDYDITGTATHSHTVSLTEDDMTMIAAGESVSVTSSSGGGHTHGVTITC